MAQYTRNKKLGDEDWWKTEPIYQIYPRSFFDSNGDGVGDLLGVLHKLDYLEWLGIRNVWLSPIYKSPMVDFGYDVSDYMDVDPIFGNLTDFEALVAKMHSKGMKLIMDFIPNHTSDQHPWFKKSIEKIDPYTDYYVWHDGKFDQSHENRKCPNNWESVFGGPSWSWCPERGQYYLHTFLPEQPNLNHRNTKVTVELKKIFNFWMDLGVDGFRIDAVPYILHDRQYRDNFSANESKTLTSIRLAETYDSDRPDHYDVIGDWVNFIRNYGKKFHRRIFTVVEAYTCLSNLGKYYDVGVDFPFNFSLSDWNQKVDADKLREKIQAYLDVVSTSSQKKNKLRPGHGCWPNWVVGNHDLSRVCTRLGSAKYADVVNMLLLLLPGTPVCYYGDELGLEDVPVTYEQCQDPPGLKLGPVRYMEKCRDPCRSPMPWCCAKNAGFTTCGKTWLPIVDRYSDICVESQKIEVNSHLNFFRKLLAFRQSKRSFVIGQNVQLCNANLSDGAHGSVLAFFRTTGEDDLNEPIFLVVLNFNPDTDRAFLVSLCHSHYKTGKLVFKTPNCQNLPLDCLLSLDAVQLSGMQGIVLEVCESKSAKRRHL